MSMEEKDIEILEQELKEFEEMVEAYYSSKEFREYVMELGEEVEL